MNTLKSKLSLALVIAVITLSALLHPYGGKDTLNSGISFGVSDTCQVGYESTGTPGFFAYCE